MHSKSYNTNTKEVISEKAGVNISSRLAGQNFIGDGKIEWGTEIWVGVCQMENDWEESIPEYGT